MLTLKEARRVFTKEELTDEELMRLIEEIDAIQMRILDNLFSL